MTDPLPLGFLLKKFVAALLLPPALPFLLIGVGLLLLRRRPRLGRLLAWGGLIGGWLLATPLTVDLIVAPLERVPPVTRTELARAQAIVILGAGAQRHAREYGGTVPNRLGLERLRYGARLARESGLPVLVSGEATAMAAVLEQDFGIRPRWREGRSLDTADNARLSAPLLAADGVRRIVLVTHAIHMRRAQAEFALHGFEVIPAPLGFLRREAGEEPLPGFLDFLPSPRAAYAGWYALHEWLGLAALALRRVVA